MWSEKGSLDVSRLPPNLTTKNCVGSGRISNKIKSKKIALLFHTLTLLPALKELLDSNKKLMKILTNSRSIRNT
jgi:hypothetical protein